jgi:hypothetical protein
MVFIKFILRSWETGRKTSLSFFTLKCVNINRREIKRKSYCLHWIWKKFLLSELLMCKIHTGSDTTESKYTKRTYAKKKNYYYLLYSYNFNLIKNTHLRHVTVHYFSVLYNRKPYFSVLDIPINLYFFRIVHYVREVTRWFCHLFTGACINGGTFNDNSYKIKVYRFLALWLDKDTVTYFFLFVHNSMNFSICKP